MENKGENKINEKERIAAKDAAVKANQYFTEIVGPRANIIVEEVELSKSGSYWLITLGYDGPSLGRITIYAKREYKIFEVDVYTGEVVSMKIREVEGD